MMLIAGHLPLLAASLHQLARLYFALQLRVLVLERGIVPQFPAKTRARVPAATRPRLVVSVRLV